MKKLIKYAIKCAPLLVIPVILSACLEVLQLAVFAAEAGQAGYEAGAGAAEIGERVAGGGYTVAERRRREIGYVDTHNPLEEKAEERLARRESAPAAGAPVDVSPYLLHAHSFAVLGNEIRRTKSAIVYGKDVNKVRVYEYDINVTFEAGGRDYQMKRTVAVCRGSGVKNYVKNYIKQYAAQAAGLQPNDIKKFKVNFLNTRKGKTQFNFEIDYVFVQNTEPCSYQFDAEVLYQRRSPFLGIGGVKPEHFDVFNNVYRSDFNILAAAAIDVQMLILKDAWKKGVKGFLPIINMVNAVKVAR